MADTAQRTEESNDTYFRMREELHANAAQNNASVNHRIYVALMLATGLAAIVALIVALVVFSNQGASTCVIGGPGNDMTGSDVTGDSKIWNLAIGHYDSNEAYIDQMTGQVKGFHVDIVYEVCKIANKNCRLQWDLYNRCWDSQVGESPRGGIGLMGGWYDGCVGWVQTYDRIRTFKFTKQFAKPIITYLVVKSNNPRGVNPADLTGKVLGFIDGFFSDEFCLARQEGITGTDLPNSQVIHFPSHKELFQAIDVGKVDAGFTPVLGGIDSIQQSLQVLGDKEYNCMLPNGGTGLMTRLDNGLPDWWNPAQDSLLGSSAYNRICADLKDAHGDVTGKDPSEICLGMYIFSNRPTT